MLRKIFRNSGDKEEEDGDYQQIHTINHGVSKPSTPDKQEEQKTKPPHVERVTTDWNSLWEALPSIQNTGPFKSKPNYNNNDQWLTRVLRFELDLRVTLSADKQVPDPRLLLISLVNWPKHYTGDYYSRTLWMTLGIVCAAHLSEKPPLLNKCYYVGEIKEGMSLKIKSLRPYNISLDQTWSQTMRILINGVNTVWGFNGKMCNTLIPYRCRRGNTKIVELLRALWIKCEVENGELVVYM